MKKKNKSECNVNLVQDDNKLKIKVDFEDDKTEGSMVFSMETKDPENNPMSNILQDVSSKLFQIMSNLY